MTKGLNQMNKIRIACVFVTFAAGCIDSSPQYFAGPHRAARFLHEPNRSPFPLNVNDEFAAIASGESTFAGMYLDADRSPVVRLTDTTHLKSVLAAGLNSSITDRKLAIDRIRVLPAAFSFKTLKQWYDREGQLGLPGVVGTSIDVTNDRLYFRVTTEADQATIADKLTALGIPREAVFIDVGPAPILTSGTVRDHIRPLIGGIQTYVYVNSTPHDTLCTLGFIVKNSAGEFFMSASHCSDSIFHFVGFPDSTWQDSVKSAHFIGTKYQDPAWYNSSPPCPTGKTPCRYSDAALWQIASGVSNSPGLIAVTTSPNSDSTQLASGSPLTITDSGGWSGGSYRAPLEGDGPFWKTGRSTGTTSGHVPAGGACYDFHPPSYPYILCETKVTAKDSLGDSGSPVYGWDGSSSTIALWGIANGKTGTDTLVFSTMENINSDFVTASYGRIDSYLVPGPALTGLTIGGPTTIGETYCVWSSTPSGGTGPFVYTWSVYGYGDSNPLQVDTTSSSTDYFGYYNLGTSFSIYATVTDFYGVEADNSLGVSGTGYSC